MPKGQSHQYTESQKAFLKENATLPRKVLTEQFNELFGTQISIDAIKGYCLRHGWLTGRDGRIQKGSKPWNTGTKGLIKPNSGNFQKGQPPMNLKPVGHERICSKDGIILIKVDEENPYTKARGYYRAKHKVVWEQHYGAIPEGYVVRFKDDNKLNCAIENLICVSKAVNLRMNKNKVNNLPKELRGVGHSIAELEVATFSARKRA